jgi:pepF/M3 family oligoendopeptidase
MSAIAPYPMPTWDLSSAFPSLESPEFSEAVAAVKAGISGFSEQLDQVGESQDVEKLERLINAFNVLQTQIRTIGAFIGGYVSTNSRDEVALAKDSEFDIALIPFAKLATRFTALLGTVDLEQLVSRSQAFSDHEYALQVAQVSAKHLMSPAEEALAADLSPTALGGWSKLHGTLTSQIEVELELKDGVKKLPMSVVRSLAYDPDGDVRKIAYEAELLAWQANEVPIAASMNGIKGTVQTLTQRRGWDSPLDEALFGANIDRETLDAMMSAAHEAFPDFRRYMQAKARLLGKKKLPFYDLFAPVGGSEKTWNYEEGAEFVSKQFHSFSARLGDFADRSYREQWIDAGPRAGKRDGAFCMWLINDESRVFMNYKNSFGSVKTLAHELGHAYHNLCLAERTMMQRRTPMTLAETASIFCETIVQNAALGVATDDEKLLILEGALEGECQVTVDITSRFLFESRVLESRKKRELSASEFKEIMIQAQLETYGDGLDEGLLHPYMWAVKPHYYSGRSFYNFPYMYGMLFGLGLYAQYQQDADAFKAKYDDLLSSTGLADAATLAADFGFNVREVGFWRSSFDVIREQIKDFEGIVDRRVGA